MIDIEDVRISLKHKIGSSGIPHGRATALLRDALWDIMWSGVEYEDRKKADILIRSHVHYHMYAGNRNHLAMTLPCLQISSGFGERQCQGTIDHGVVEFTIDGSEYQWKSHLMEFKNSRKVITL
jgi:hypothetical protein